MPLRLLPAAASCLLLLAGCGGMTRTVGVLPNTLDDLGQRSEALRGAGVSSPPPSAEGAADRNGERVP